MQKPEYLHLYDLLLYRGPVLYGKVNGGLTKIYLFLRRVVVVVVVVFTLNRSLYPTASAVPPVSFLILHPRDTKAVVTDNETEEPNAKELR